MTQVAPSAGLKRQLGFWDSVAINVGIVIGVGIFRVPAEVAKYLDSPSWILLAWLAGGLVSLCGVFCYAELSSRFPQTGGTYIFLRESYGRLVAFLYGWTEFSMLRAGSLAAVAYVLAAYFTPLVGMKPGAEPAVAISAIAFFTLINIAGIRFGTGVQNILSSLKVVTILGMSAAIFYFLPQGAPSHAGISSGGAPSPALFFVALIPILFSYGGWHESTFMSGEFKETKKLLPLSLIASSLIVMGLYLLMNAAYLSAEAPHEMVHSKAIAADIFMRFFGSSGQRIVTIAILISACGALNSTILTGGRIPFALGSDYPRVSWLSRVHANFETPYVAMIFNSVWAAILVCLGNFERLLFFYGFAKWLVFAFAGVSVFIFRRRQAQSPGTFVMPGYPWVPALFVLSSVGLCGVVIQNAPREAMIGAGLILAGLPIYFAMREKRCA